MLATVVAATAGMKTIEKEWHTWNKGTSCAKFHW